MVAQLGKGVIAYQGQETLTAVNGTCTGPDEFSTDLQTTVGRDSLVGTATG